MSINGEIVQLGSQFVTSYLERELPEAYCYHNKLHTTCIVNAINEISEGMTLTDHERNILLIAGWFHDVGYIWQIEGHESVGACLAETFLKHHQISKEDIDQVKRCIIATKYPQKPATILEQVIGDADMFHLGQKDFFEKSALIRKEWSRTRQTKYTNAEWYQLNLDFVKQHDFHTTYCKKNCNTRKEKNIRQIEKLLKKEKQINSIPGNEENNSLKNNKTNNKEKSERGVETLFKTASRNHMELSSMADSKAHILLSINSIIISIVLSVLSKRLEQSSYMLFPTALLLTVCLATIVFAVLTTQPKISKGTFTKEQVAKREANLLFFGNFHNMNLPTYEWGVKQIMSDKDYLYSSLTRDVYYLGKVLAIKYRYLNIGYKIFMFGLIASVFAFAIGFCSTL
jgi:predicted metal-dependent HD superfamily phosphohydrolase